MQQDVIWAFLLLNAIYLLGLHRTDGASRPTFWLARNRVTCSLSYANCGKRAVFSGASSGGAIVLEKLQRPDAELPHMLHLGEEFDRAVWVAGHLLSPPYGVQPSLRDRLQLAWHDAGQATAAAVPQAAGSAAAGDLQGLCAGPG